MVKVGISISIDDEYRQYCTNHGINISKWVNKKMAEEFTDIDKKLEKIKQEEEELKFKREELLKLKEQNKEKVNKLITAFSEEQRNELRNSARIIQERGMPLFKPRYNRYKNIFGYITIDEFRELVGHFTKIL